MNRCAALVGEVGASRLDWAVAVGYAQRVVGAGPVGLGADYDEVLVELDVGLATVAQRHLPFATATAVPTATASVPTPTTATPIWLNRMLNSSAIAVDALRLTHGT